MMDPGQRKTIDAIARLLGECQSILFITGAGVSADSGVPTYRGIGGLYEVEITEEGLPIEEVLSGAMLGENPALAWKYLAQIAAAARGARFNRAHEVMAACERRFPRVWTLTQNVDGLHRAAGSRNLIEIHGNMRSLSCTACGYRQSVSPDEDVPIPPRCLDCQSILRPDVVLFGEMLPEEAMNTLYRELETGFDAVFSVGTSSLFPYIQEPVISARHFGTPTIEINPGQTVLSDHVDYRMAMGAAEAMQEIWSRVAEGG